MNLFNEAIYKNHLEHTAAGTKWGKHKYLYITETGRYVYPEDVRNGQSADEFRKRQINDQIKSAHSNATSSKMELTPGSELKKRAEARAAAKTSGTAAGSKSVATNTSNRNTISIKSEDKKTEENSSTDNSKYKNMSEETKAWLEKEAAKGEKKEEDGKKKGSGKKGGSGKKKGSGSSSKKSASTKTQEANQMGLSDDDLKNMEVNTDATNRDEVLKNIALRVIRGDYGNGTDRKAKLGNYYDEVQKRVNEIMKEGDVQREGQSQQQTESKKSQTANTTSSSSKESSNRKYKQELYKEGDKDFDDSKYNESTRLGNTDFHAYKRDDGKYVILEEDMKWVVDEKPSTKMIKNLEAMDEYIDARRKNGTWEPKNASKEWDELASIAINGGDLTERAKAEKAKIKNKKSVKHYDLTEGGNYLMHIGRKRRSGRYRFGSGDRPYQHESNKRHMRKNSSFSDRRSMTDEELVSALNRVRKEVDLYRAERDNRSQGQRFVEEVLTSVGKNVIIGAATGGLKYAGKKFVEGALGEADLANAMFGGGGGKKKNKHKD